MSPTGFLESDLNYYVSLNDCQRIELKLLIYIVLTYLLVIMIPNFIKEGPLNAIMLYVMDK